MRRIRIIIYTIPTGNVKRVMCLIKTFLSWRKPYGVYDVIPEKLLSKGTIEKVKHFILSRV
jgi:hypothetical protein